MTDPPADEGERKRLEAAAAGDRDALEELLCDSLPELRKLVERRAGPLVRSRMTDSDIIQSVCVEILRHGDTFQHPSSHAFRRWLYATTLRKLSHKKADLFTQKRDASRDTALEGEDGQPIDLIDPTQASPSRQSVVSEELRRLEGALESLPEEYRTVILLSKIGEHPREEIATRMGRTTGSVRMLLHRALAKLAVTLEENDGPSERP